MCLLFSTEKDRVPYYDKLKDKISLLLLFDFTKAIIFCHALVIVKCSKKGIRNNLLKLEFKSIKKWRSNVGLK